MASLSKIAREHRNRLLDAFSESLQQIRDDATIKDIADRMESGDIEGVLRILNINEASFEPMVTAIREAYRVGGKTGAEQIGKIPTSEGSISFQFDVRSDRAERVARELSSQLVVEIVEQQREMIRERMSQAIADGRNPRESALDLVGRRDRFGSRKGGFIGMTRQQSASVQRAREELESLDPRYLQRELRDKRFDAKVKKAIDNDEPLDQKSIKAATTQLQQNTLDFRGKNIARTESITSLRAGQHESIRQAIEQGDIDERDAQKVWDASGDARVRTDHNVLDGQRRAFNEPFTAPDGSQLQYPGDSSLGADASQVVNCRCKERTVIDFSGEVRRVEGFDPP